MPIRLNSVAPVPPDGAPTNVKVESDLSATRLVVTWDAVVGAVGYKVYRGLSQNQAETRLVSVTEILVSGEAVVRGSDEVGRDTLASADVFEVQSISLTPAGSLSPEEDFINGVDYFLVGNQVTWRNRNRAPVAGQTYYVTYVKRVASLILAPTTRFEDPHAHARIRTNYWYSVSTVEPGGGESERSLPVTVVFVASDLATRNFNKSLERF